MKHLLALLILLTTLAGGPTHAANPEFRGIWVHNWKNGLLCPEEVDATVKWAVDTNMNAIIVQVRKAGDAYYNSAYEPRATNIKGAPDFDPLGYAISQARANGLEIHAWFNVYRVATGTAQLPPNHVAALHPEWLSEDVNGNNKSADGIFLDPGVPEVNSYIASLIADILSKYDIDGINLDFIRYPDKNWGYNPIAVQRFNAEYGRTGKPSPNDPQWCQWRRNNVTEMVRTIRNEINIIKPKAKLSAATITWGACPTDFTRTDAYSRVFQDWRLWMEQGLLDANIPMNYQNPSVARNATNFSKWLDGFKRWSYGRQTYCGLMVFNNNVSGVEKQIITTRMKGADGIVGFAFPQSDCAVQLSQKLRSQVLFRSAPVPPMTWKNQMLAGSKID